MPQPQPDDARFADAISDGLISPQEAREAIADLPSRRQGWFAALAVTGVMVLALVIILIGGGW